MRESLFAAYKDVQRMVRDGRWKLIWYPKADRFQLFDLASDPDEVDDLSGEAGARREAGGDEEAVGGATSEVGRPGGAAVGHGGALVRRTGDVSRRVNAQPGD